MKGVILGINPAGRIVDLSHQIPPQDVYHAAFFLVSAIPYFPPGVIHVVVVDPGVGTKRALLYVEVEGQRLLVPDNGCWTLLGGAICKPALVIRLTEPRYWRESVSPTFHGRDILAPVAGHLSLGVDPKLLGTATSDWVGLDVPQPRLEADDMLGEVIFVDHFGNLITNIPADALGPLDARPLRIIVGEHDINCRVRTYAEAEPGTPVALVGSTGLLEIAVTQGNAALQLRAGIGTKVRVTAKHGQP